MVEIKYKISNKIKEFLEGAKLTEISIGCSDSQVIKVEKNNKIYYLKIAKGKVLTSEYEKLKYFEGKIKIPKIVLYDNVGDIEFLVTTEIAGEMLCSEFYLNNSLEGIPIILEAFNNLYKVDVTNCPFNVDINYKLRLVKNNIDKGLIDINNVSKSVIDRFGTLDNIYSYLVNNKSIVKDELCFSHGDTSLPNIFAKNNAFSGFIDIGECGIAEKWFDIAIVAKSIVRNYGKDALVLFYKQLSVEENKAIINYYHLLMELYL